MRPEERKWLKRRLEALFEYKLPWNEDTNLGSASSLIADIWSCYHSPGRHYHDLDHILDCLHTLDHLPSTMHPRDRLIAELAIWYHDILDPIEPSGPVSSASYAFQCLTSIGVSKDLAKAVRICVKGTDYHAVIQNYDNLASAGSLEGLGHIVQYCDLASLGAPPRTFLENTKNVLREVS